MSSLACAFLEKIFKLGYPDTGWCCVEVYLIFSVLRPQSTGTGGIEVSLPGPNHYYSMNTTSLLFSFSKVNIRDRTFALKLSVFTKINPKPSLPYPLCI